jgi:hypothetical protein
MSDLKDSKGTLFFATRALKSGEVDLIALSSILRHSVLKMMTRYAQPGEQMKAEAIRRIEKKRAKAV